MQKRSTSVSHPARREQCFRTSIRQYKVKFFMGSDPGTFLFTFTCFFVLLALTFILNTSCVFRFYHWQVSNNLNLLEVFFLVNSLYSLKYTGSSYPELHLHISASHKTVACCSPRRGVDSFEQRRELPLPLFCL